jgi:hypothetical protein
MKGDDAPGLAIGLRERYRDLVSDRWPVIVAPQPDELLSSWVHRLAYANGVAPRAFAPVLGLGPGMWSACLDVMLPADVVTLLNARTGVSAQQVTEMSLAQSPLRPLLLPLRGKGLRGTSTWLQFCSRCLFTDEQPYFRRQWRLATRISCPHHCCGLRDRCPSCRSRIAVFDQIELVPQHVCACCGFDLRRAPKITVSAAARRLDRCIDDICKLEAIAGSLINSNLIPHLLSVPTVAGTYSPTPLTGLSTSARVRCFERLVGRRLDWLVVDDNVMAAHWRRSILSVGGHRPLIALLTDALERRYLRTRRRAPAAKLSDVLGAYVQIMEGPRRPRPRNERCRHVG